MRSPLSPRLLAAFGALILLLAGMGAFALSVMDDLSARIDHLSRDNIPGLIAADDAQFALREFHQMQLSAPAHPGGETRARVARRLDLQNEVTVALRERARSAPQAAERAAVDHLIELWRRYQLGGGTAEADFAALHDGLLRLRLTEETDVAASRAQAQRSYDRTRTLFIALLVGGVLGAGGLGAWFLVARPVRRAAAADGYRRGLHEALEMADTEEEALDVTERALGRAAPRTPVEMLLADSSQAHLHRALVAGPEPDGPGCGVEGPRGCAAVRRGQTTVFPSSEDVGACPRLRGRPGGPCSAVCTPVAILGRTIGVLHATGPEGRPPAGPARDVLETTSAQVGSRLGVIRALTQSQLQASTDPLTGLLNRRSLEDRVGDLRRARVPFTVAMADLDHFKALNDSAGHETGDRALRVFARTLAETVRAQDVVARHGGEEFVVVFPRCSAREAAEVLERVREALAGAVAAADVPEFTFSVGVTEARPDDALADALRAADEALMSAKRAGRDRILIASPIRDAP